VECFVLYPNWTTTLWWVKVQVMCDKAHFLPPATRLFETERDPSGPIKWGVWVIYIFKGIQTASVRFTKQLEWHRQLKVKIGWEVGGEEFSPVWDLIDTGAEVCFVNKCLIPKRFSTSQASFTPDWCQRAGAKVWDTEVKLVLILIVVDKQTTNKVEIHIHTVLYEVDIQDDVILTYSWCQLRSVEIHPSEHVILWVSKEHSVWLEVSLGVQEADRSSNILVLQTTTVHKPKRALDLFGGIRSGSKVLTE